MSKSIFMYQGEPLDKMTNEQLIEVIREINQMWDNDRKLYLEALEKAYQTKSLDKRQTYRLVDQTMKYCTKIIEKIKPQPSNTEGDKK